MLFEGFTLSMIDLGEVTVRVRHGGSGPPLRLLHGQPQTHMLVVWSKEGYVNQWYDVLSIWRNWADDVRGEAIEGNHYFAEQTPEATYDALYEFFAT